MISVIKRILNRSEADCKEVRRLSSDYLEDELPPAKRSSVQGHLSGCGPCQAFVQTLASTIGLLSRLPRVPTSSAFKRTVMQRTTRREGRGSS